MEKVRVFLTGFGSFPGCPSNPTELCVRALRGSPDFDGSDVVGVSGIDSLRSLLVLQSRVLSLPADAKVLVLHLGVNGGASEFAIEGRAFNEAHFPGNPDVRGWEVLDHQQLNPSLPLGKTLETDLPIDSIAQMVGRESGLPVVVSRDAGRYICNFIYWHSLEFAASSRVGRVHSLFCHVPPEEVFSIDLQAFFVSTLVRVVRDAISKL